MTTLATNKRQLLRHHIDRQHCFMEPYNSPYRTKGNHINPGVLTHAFNRIATRAGVNSVRFHDLRHTRFDLTVDL